MDHETFKSIITQMQEDSLATLLEKNSGYSNADPLHNFHQAAKLKGETTLKAIGGMMAKHTVSIYDLINKASEDYIPEEVWFEKIQDHLNYLLFLWAAVEETEIEQNSFELSENLFEETPSNSKKPDLNSDEAPMPAAYTLTDKYVDYRASDEALDELRRKLMAPILDADGSTAKFVHYSASDEEAVTTEYKDEPKDDWVAPKNVMINKEI